jgi:hypothetical protein
MLVIGCREARRGRWRDKVRGPREKARECERNLENGTRREGGRGRGRRIHEKGLGGEGDGRDKDIRQRGRSKRKKEREKENKKREE